jgi:hypothetical protein
LQNPFGSNELSKKSPRRHPVMFFRIPDVDPGC